MSVMKNRKKSSGKREKGQAMVEFAIIFPLMLLLIFAAVDIGWVTEQRGMFRQGCNHISWNITADALGDTDPMEEAGSRQTYGTSVLAPLIYSELKTQSIWGYDPNHLVVRSASAELYNSEGNYYVPGRDPAVQVSAISRTRYLDLNAEISYEIYPLTFVGRMIFGNRVILDETLSCTRVIGTQNKSE